MQMQQQVTPVTSNDINLIKHGPSIKDILCVACCCGIYRYTHIDICRSNGVIKEEIPNSNCPWCWLCGCCRFTSYSASSNERIEMDTYTAYCLCCFCWDFDGTLMVCAVPVN